MIDITSEKIRKDVIRRDFFDEDDSFFKKLNISRERYEKYFGPNGFLVKLSDGYYYTKEVVSEFKLCNEITGRFLCSKVGLATTSLELLVDHEDTIKMITPNYRKKDLSYFYQKDDVNLLFSYNYNIDKLRVLPKVYQKEQFKLIALDVMMEQRDRHSHNMEEVIINDNIHLAPIIDFEYSFDYAPLYNYYNPYLNLPKNFENICKFLDDFPDAYQCFLEAFNVDVDEIIKYIEDNHPIKVDNNIREIYSHYTGKNQMILKLVR